jgi:hypothetical protein
MSRTSLALNNLRAVVILIVLAFHSVSAYLGSLAPSAYPFDKAPYLWNAFPIVDSHRWFGFDVLCAWQDVYLMGLMFFLSALFAWPSLVRKGTRKFLGDRFLRLGVPCAFGMAILMPIALYPVYRVTARDPGVGAYVGHFLALPFWPNGPTWFLWQLLALTVLGAGLFRFAPRSIAFLAARAAEDRPLRHFAVFSALALLAYVPLALLFSPFGWVNHGMFSVQYSRPLLYIVAYVAGLCVGANGLESGLLAENGRLVRHWALWLTGASLAFVAWMLLTALTLRGSPSLALRVATDASFALACTSGVFAALALMLRFGAVQSRVLDNLGDNAFGYFILHYPFVVWMQYALLGTALFAVAKGAIVFAVTLFASWLAVSALRAVPFGLPLIGGERRVRARAPAQAGPEQPFGGGDRLPQGIR